VIILWPVWLKNTTVRHWLPIWKKWHGFNHKKWRLIRAPALMQKQIVGRNAARHFCFCRWCNIKINSPIFPEWRIFFMKIWFSLIDKSFSLIVADLSAELRRRRKTEDRRRKTPAWPLTQSVGQGRPKRKSKRNCSTYNRTLLYCFVFIITIYHISGETPSNRRSIISRNIRTNSLHMSSNGNLQRNRSFRKHT